MTRPPNGHLISTQLAGTQTTHSSLLKNINKPRSSSVGEKQRSHVAGITSAHRRGETTPLHGMRMSFSEIGTIYTHRKAALTFTC